MLDYLHEWIQAAEAGSLEAMYWVAWDIIWSDQSQPLEPELVERALHYFHAAAEGGIGCAMLDLGGMYVTSDHGVERDLDIALKWYLKAEEVDDVKAYRCLGNYYMYNSGPKAHTKTQDEEKIRKAIHYYQLGASRHSEQNCLYELGDLYMEGKWMERDAQKAFELYQKSYDMIGGEPRDDSYSDVCLRLGKCYLHGRGVERDLKKAEKLLRIAKNECARSLAVNDACGASSLKEATSEWVVALRALDQEEAERDS